MDKKELGDLGEELASHFLKENKFQILDRNWKFNRFELDIIATDGEKIIFVEVKTRENNYLGEPWEAVGRAKQRKIISSADHYLVSKNIDKEARFDIVSIIHNQKETKIQHIEDAFYPRM